MIQLVVQPSISHVLAQPLRPVSERGRLESKLNGLATRRLLVGGVEVVEQNAPGNAIDHQMVRRKEKERPSPNTELEQYSLQERAMSQIEARVDIVGDVLDTSKLLIKVHMGKVMPLKHLHRLDGRVALVPLAVDLLESHPQRVVVLEHRIERSLDGPLV